MISSCKSNVCIGTRSSQLMNFDQVPEYFYLCNGLGYGPFFFLLLDASVIGMGFVTLMKFKASISKLKLLSVNLLILNIGFNAQFMAINHTGIDGSSTAFEHHSGLANLH